MATKLNLSTNDFFQIKDSESIPVEDKKITLSTLKTFINSNLKLNDLKNVDISNPIDNQILKFNGSVWENKDIPELPANTDLSKYDNHTSKFINENYLESSINLLNFESIVDNVINLTSETTTGYKENYLYLFKSGVTVTDNLKIKLNLLPEIELDFKTIRQNEWYVILFSENKFRLLSTTDKILTIQQENSSCWTITQNFSQISLDCDNTGIYALYENSSKIYLTKYNIDTKEIIFSKLIDYCIGNRYKICITVNQKFIAISYYNDNGIVKKLDKYSGEVLDEIEIDSISTPTVISDSFENIYISYVLNSDINVLKLEKFNADNLLVWSKNFINGASKTYNSSLAIESDYLFLVYGKDANVLIEKINLYSGISMQDTILDSVTLNDLYFFTSIVTRADSIYVSYYSNINTTGYLHIVKINRQNLTILWHNKYYTENKDIFGASLAVDETGLYVTYHSSENKQYFRKFNFDGIEINSSSKNSKLSFSSIISKNSILCISYKNHIEKYPISSNFICENNDLYLNQLGDSESRFNKIYVENLHINTIPEFKTKKIGSSITDSNGAISFTSDVEPIAKNNTLGSEKKYFKEGYAKSYNNVLLPNITKLQKGLEKLLKLKIVDTENGYRVLPNYEPLQDNQYTYIDLCNFISLTTKAIQELSEKYEKLKKKRGKNV